MTTKQKIIIKDKIPYSALTVTIDRMKEMNESPELWAEFLTRIKSKVLEDELFPPSYIFPAEELEMEMTTQLDSVLVGVMENPTNWSRTVINLFEYDIEIRYELGMVIVVFRREQLISVVGENIS